MSKAYSTHDLHAAIVQNPSKTAAEIAAMVGCSNGAVRQYAARHKLPLLKLPGRNGGRPKGTSKGDEKYRERRAYGKRIKEEPKQVERPPMQAGMMGSGRVYAPSYTRVL